MSAQILTQHDLERAVSNIEATLGDVQKDWEQRTTAVSVRREGGGRVGRRESREEEGKEGERSGGIEGREEGGKAGVVLQIWAQMTVEFPS